MPYFGYIHESMLVLTALSKLSRDNWKQNTTYFKPYEEIWRKAKVLVYLTDKIQSDEHFAEIIKSKLFKVTLYLEDTKTLVKAKSICV